MPEKKKIITEIERFFDSVEKAEIDFKASQIRIIIVNGKVFFSIRLQPIDLEY